MKDDLLKIKTKVMEELKVCKDSKTLEDIRVAIFGKKGELTHFLRGMSALDEKQRPIVGQMVNDLREEITEALNSKKSMILKEEQQSKMAQETLDITLPGKKPSFGYMHPMAVVIDELSRIFMGMGYEIAHGPDIETDYYNFEALNIPKNHPAKDEQDTFYTDGSFLLRTQTSPVQIRKMKEGKLPIAIIAPGKVFRADEVDATHSPVFHQLEGLVIDKGISMAHLKGALTTFAHELFGKDTNIRFRPHHFPFTEPSAEMDISCFGCGGKGCRICKNEGYIELLGCGMVHRNVLENCGIDPLVYSGFAFGMGLERLAMQKYKIEDMRLLFENDINFLMQF